MHCAVEGGNAVLVEWLLETSAYDDCEPAKPRISPLHVAVQHGHLHLLDRLMKHGYSPLERTPDGKTTVHLAASGFASGPVPARGISAADRQAACLLKMLDLGVDPQLLDSGGCSALHCAAGKSFFHTAVLGGRQRCNDGVASKWLLRKTYLASTGFTLQTACKGFTCAEPLVLTQCHWEGM